MTIVVSLATFILPYKIWGKPLNKFTYEDVKAKDQKDLDAWRTADEHDFTIDFSNETAKANTKGGANALVRLVEFTDYECPACRVANPTIKEIKEKYGDKISLTIKQYPLDNTCNSGMSKKFHVHACNAAKVALCSKSQGKFFEVSEILYSLPEFTEENSVESASLALFKKLNEQGIDTAKISACLKNGEVDKLLESEIEEGNKAKLTGTPSLFINGSKVPALKKELIVKIIDYVLSSK